MDFPTPLTSGPSQAAFDSLYAQVQGAVPLPTYTVATLPVPGPSLLNRLAGVTDLFGNRTTRVRCERITVGGVDYHYWQPQSSDSYGSIPVTTADMTVEALTMPTTLNLTGNIAASVTRTVTLAPGAFPGQVKELRYAGVLGLLAGLNILGTGLGTGVGILAGGYSKFASDWSTGTPAWIRVA